MRYLIILLALLCGAAQAAAPSISCAYSQTSGVAPLSVLVDCKATDSGPGNSFFNLLYSVNFGDTNPGNWAYGANTAQSKNFGSGPVTAHVYETHGTFTIRIEVRNSAGEVSRATQAITVTNPNTVFSANTACVAIASTPVAGEDSCPSGAFGVRKDDGDFDAMLSTQLGASSACGASGCKRILLKAGETTWQSSANGTLGVAGPGYIGKYGSAANPIITLQASTNQSVLFTNSTGADWRIVGLEIDGGDVATGRAIRIEGDKTTVANVIVRDSCYGVIAATADDMTIYNSVFVRTIGGSGCVQIYVDNGGATNRMSIIGNSVTNALAGEHNVRIGGAQVFTISNNTISEPASSKAVLTVRGPDFDAAGLYTEYGVISGNVLGPATTSFMNSISPQNDTVDERLRRIIVERNEFVFDTDSTNTSTIALLIQATEVHARNNLFILTNSDNAAAQGLNITYDRSGGGLDVPVPNLNVFENNTFYAAGTQNFCGVRIAATGATNTTVKNNLAYAPASTDNCQDSGDTGGVLLLDSSSGTTATTNSSNAQVKNTSPAFASATPSNPADFRISTASYAADGGTAQFPASNDDFFNCDDVTANERIGAMVPRARATCRGVK